MFVKIIIAQVIFGQTYAGYMMENYVFDRLTPAQQQFWKTKEAAAKYENKVDFASKLIGRLVDIALYYYWLTVAKRFAHMYAWTNEIQTKV